MCAKIFVIIPCYKVTKHIQEVIKKIGPEVEKIIVVDDCCPEKSGNFVQQHIKDPRIDILFHEKNKGVGGAIISGYRRGLELKGNIFIKIDGDGQMDPRLIPAFIKPLIHGKADYVKGNRFYSLYDVSQMPSLRFWGNTILSFMTKMSSGYWSIFDPTNGFTGIHKSALTRLSLENISRRYFFESDMLISLGGIRAKVVDFPMTAIYEDELSNLKIKDILIPFIYKHNKAIFKRLLYQYYLRDFSLASISLPIGILLFLFGFFMGTVSWVESVSTGIPATAGTVILAALPLLIGIQFILNFFSFDISNEPKTSLQLFEDGIPQNRPKATDNIKEDKG